MLWKCCTQYASKFGKLSSGHRTGKGQFSLQSQRKTMPKNVQTTAQLNSSHMLAKYCWKFPKLGFNTMWSENFQMVQAGFRKGRGTRDQIASICWIIKNSMKIRYSKRELWSSRCSSWIYKRQRNKRSNCQHLLDHRKQQENSRKTSTSALLITPKPLTV